MDTNNIIRVKDDSSVDEFSARALKARGNNEQFNIFVTDSKQFILKCTSKICAKYITDSDDEWSVALMAFHEAVESYDITKGKFSSFSYLVIKRRLYDSFEKEKRHRSEIATRPDALSGDIKADDAGAYESEVARAATGSSNIVTMDNPVKDEVDALNQELAAFGFELFEVAADSPKANKTKRSCGMAVSAIIEHKVLYESLKGKKKLPYEELLKVDLVTKKVLERHRKYIIMAVIVLTGDYPLLAEYVKNIRER